MKMTLAEFTFEIEGILESEVKKLLPGYWDEDQLTINFLIALTRKLSNKIIVDLRGVSKVYINAFKQSGTLTETKYGDIAIILNITFPDGEKLEGVGYLEAKKRAEGAVTFDAVRKVQLETINANAPRARLLLYDYEPITGFVPTYFEEELYYRHHYRTLRLMPTTHSVALPLNLALQVKHFDTQLYKFGLPFSHQLTFRYMYGQDLEFEKVALDASKGYADRQNLSKYILTITVGPEDKIYEPENIANTNNYERLK
ncbi:MAG TPA: hypothetical protein VIH57_12195 [Bacteroidales bacterium]